MFEQFPYADMQQLNLDWMIKIAKDFLDQYTHIQQVITQGLEDLDTKATQIEALLDEWYNTHSEDIANQLESALNDLNTWYETHEGYLNQELIDNINAFSTRAEQIAQAAIASIPADYTEQNAKIARNLNDLNSELMFSIKPYEATGHGFYESDGSFTANNNYDSFYIPVRGNAFYKLSFSGTGANFMCINTYDANGDFIKTYGRVADMQFMTDENAAFIGIGCLTADVALLDIETYSMHFQLDYLFKNIYLDSINLMPAEPTGHGLYLASGVYETNAGWNSYYIPVLPNTKYRMVFTGTSNQYNNTCEYAKDGSFVKHDGRTRSFDFITSPTTYWIGFATIDREANAVNVYYVTTKALLDEFIISYNNMLAQGIMTNFEMIDSRTARPITNFQMGNTFYFRCLSSTDPNIVGLSIYGMNTGADPVNLAFARVGGGIVKYTAEQTFEYLQVSLNPYPQSFTGTVKYSLLVSNIPGITQDAYNNQNDGVSRNLNIHTANIFKKVVCCGDSFTAGYINIDPEEGRVIATDYAWPAFMEKITGSEYVNCGVSGANVLTWQTSENGLLKAQTEGLTQAYMIGLLINDISYGERGVPLGTYLDIGSDAPTYYGGMSKIIRELNAISPTAKIFVLTCPQAGDSHPYNEAIRTIVETYENTYPVHCLDITKYPEIWDKKSFTNDYINGHYTGIGYEQMAEGLNYCLSKYIDDNVAAFQDVHEIPY